LTVFFIEGQSVFFEQKENENWKLGQIIDQCNPRSYVVQNEDGVKYRRNRVKIRPTDITANIRDRSPPRSVTLKLWNQCSFSYYKLLEWQHKWKI
jgi:hypothetical protein